MAELALASAEEQSTIPVSPQPKTVQDENQVTLMNISNSHHLLVDNQDPLTAFLHDIGLDSYEDVLRERGFGTADGLSKMTDDDIAEIFTKPVHQRKMKDWINGRSLKTYSIEVETETPSKMIRRPTPRGDSWTSMSSPSTSLLRKVSSVRDIAVAESSENNGKQSSEEEIDAAATLASVGALESCGESGMITPAKLLLLFSSANKTKKPMSIVEQRLIVLGSLPALSVNDSAAYTDQFWSQLNTPDFNFGKLMGEIMTGRQAVRNTTSGAARMASYKTCVVDNLRKIRKGMDNVKKRRRKMSDIVELDETSFNENRLATAQAGNEFKQDNEEEDKGDDDELINETHKEVLELFQCVIKAWNDAVVLNYKCYAGLMSVANVLQLVQKTHPDEILASSKSEKVRVLAEEVLSKCVEFFKVKLDVVRAAAGESKEVQNFIQIEVPRTFLELSGPLDDVVNPFELDSACRQRVVVPHGAMAGNRLRVMLSVNSEPAVQYDIKVPKNAVAGETVLVLPASPTSSSSSPSFDNESNNGSAVKSGGILKKKPTKSPRNARSAAVFDDPEPSKTSARSASPSMGKRFSALFGNK